MRPEQPGEIQEIQEIQMSEPVSLNAPQSPSDATMPTIRDITMKDVGDALAAGLRDFQAAPLYGMFFGALYAAGGMALIFLLIWMGASYLAYPLAAGFALIGPFIAVGLYEVSRRREASLPLSWSAVFGVVFGQGKREMGWMALVTLFIFIIWMYQVRLLLALFVGLSSFGTMREFLDMLLTTPEGLLFLVVGNAVGAVLALVLFALTVISFPLLLDRDVDFITAMITSVQTVLRNPAPMIAWGLIIAIDLIFSAIPMFLGLILTLPVIGHATWHLYRRAIVPAPDAAGG